MGRWSAAGVVGGFTRVLSVLLGPWRQLGSRCSGMVDDSCHANQGCVPGSSGLSIGAPTTHARVVGPTIDLHTVHGSPYNMHF